MRFILGPTGLAVLCLSCCLLCGCFPVADRNAEETKNPHFQAGVARKISRDYEGAIEAFEKALEANPQSSAAHLELGLIYYQQVHDYATAIYFFQKYVKLRPEAPQRSLLKDYIDVCKQELAKDVSFAIVNQQVQAKLTDLERENSELRTRVSNLLYQLALASNRLAATLSLPQPGTNPPLAVTQVGTSTNLRQPVANPPPSLTNAPPRTRSYTVKAGDTFTSIARQHGVKVSAISAANPRVDPRRLRRGQVLNIPAS